MKKMVVLSIRSVYIIDRSYIHEYKTRRLLLAPLGPEFLETTHKYASDYENTKLMVHLPKDDLSETRFNVYIGEQ